MQLETNLLREDFEIETEHTQLRFITKKRLLAKKYLQMHAGVVFSHVHEDLTVVSKLYSVFISLSN